MNEQNLFEIQRQRTFHAPGSQQRERLPWGALEQQVVRMQKQITHASQRGDPSTVHLLQQRLLESEAARLLAVRRAAEENRGKDTAGIDGVKSLTQSERLAMASAIHPSQWQHQRPRPVRRVWIPKPDSTQRRPLAILSMIDRCKQALVKLALEPEWEATFEPHSYGFRPGRGTHDAIAAIMVAIARHPAYVCNADIAEAFDHLHQAPLLDKLHTFPALRQEIHDWLTAGVMEGSTYVPSERGIAQGGVLSPLLLNIALHGMEGVVTGSSNDGEPPLLVRYADNFVIVHTDLGVVQRAIQRVRHWLTTMGFHLPTHKTRITHTLTPSQGQVGFDFLGFHLHQERVGQQARERARKVKTIITPNQEASERHLATIEQRLQRLHSASPARVIAQLNPLIAGWATYYTGMVEPATLRRYDELLERRLLHWASTRHPGEARAELIARYWHQVGKGRQVFAAPDGKRLRSYQHASILRG
jgi:RNA-directed DNA polymerase